MKHERWSIRKQPGPGSVWDVTHDCGHAVTVDLRAEGNHGIVYAQRDHEPCSAPPTEDDTDCDCGSGDSDLDNHWSECALYDSSEPTEDDTERVERVETCAYGPCDLPPEPGGRAYCTIHGVKWGRGPDPATVERARAEGREQGLREAEQAVRALGPDIENLLATAREVVDEHNRNPGEEPCCGSCESAPELAHEVLRLHEPTNATVERVARALYEHQYREDRYSPLGTWATRSAAWKRQWLDEARAALRALSSATPSAPEGTPTDD